MKAPFFFSIFFTFLSLHLNSQNFPPDIQWQKSVGGSQSDEIPKVRQTLDGGYVAFGYSWSNDGNATVNYGEGDYWVVKFDSLGVMQWQKSYGGSRAQYGYDIQQLPDSGYILIGETQLSDGDVTGYHGGSFDCWILRINKTGAIKWKKTFGGSKDDRGRSITPTSDGGYIFTASTSSNDGDVSGFHGSLGYDFWVVKIDSSGIIQWQKTLGGDGQDEPAEIVPTMDGGYMVSGYSSSQNGDVTGNKGMGDAWIVKLDSLGNIAWNKCYGGSNHDGAGSAAQTADGGYIISAYTQSDDGDVAGYHGMSDLWVIKTDAYGAIEWQKTLGGTGDDLGGEIQQTFDSGYVVVGFSESNDGDLDSVKGLTDVWVVKLTDSGTIKWSKTMGGSDLEYAYSIRQSSDSGYIVGALSASNDGDLTTNHGMTDYWIIKLAKDVKVNTWGGATNAAWEDPANWTAGVVPDNDTAVVIEAGSVILNKSTRVRNLYLKPKVNFTVRKGANLTIKQK